MTQLPPTSTSNVQTQIFPNVDRSEQVDRGANPVEAATRPAEVQEGMLERALPQQDARAEARFATTPLSNANQGPRVGDLLARANFQQANQTPQPPQASPQEVKESEFKRNWHLGVGYQALSLQNYQGTDKAVLARADGNGDGQLTREEAWTYLDQTLDANPTPNDGKAMLEPTASAQEFEQTLGKLFTERSGRTVEGFKHSNIDGDVLYVQFNRNNGRTREEKDVASYVKKDKDSPSLTRHDMTTAFNGWQDPAEGKDAFKAEMRDYIKQLKSDNKSMTGFVLSGHSNGQDMLQELPDHSYVAKLDVRAALTELRNEDPEIAQYFDQVEYVALQACFQGSAVGEWDQIFPNATIAGTEKYGPLANSKSAGKILQAAIKGHTAVEYGQSVAEAEKAAGSAINKDLRKRDVVVEVPEQRLERAKVKLTDAQSNFSNHEAKIKEVHTAALDVLNADPDASYDDLVNQLAQEFQKQGWSSTDFKTLYTASNLRALAERGVATLEGRDPNSAQIELFGASEELATLEAMTSLLFDLRFAM